MKEKDINMILTFEFAQHLKIALFDAQERLRGEGCNEITYCISRLQELHPMNHKFEAI